MLYTNIIPLCRRQTGVLELEEAYRVTVGLGVRSEVVWSFNYQASTQAVEEEGEMERNRRRERGGKRRERLREKNERERGEDKGQIEGKG